MSDSDINFVFLGNPGGDGSHHAYTYMQLQQGNFDKVIEAAKEGLEVESDDHTYNYCMAMALWNLGRDEEVKPYLQKAVDTVGADDKVHKKYVLFLKEQGASRYRDAVSKYKEGFFEEAEVLDAESKGLYKEAIAHTNKIMPDLLEGQEWFYNRQGLCFFHLNDMDEAEESFRKALDINPEDNRARLNMGVPLVLKGDWDGAYDLLSGMKTNDKAEETTLKLNLAGIFNRRGDVQAALTHYVEFLALCDKNDSKRSMAETAVVDLESRMERMPKFDGGMIVPLPD